MAGSMLSKSKLRGLLRTNRASGDSSPELGNRSSSEDVEKSTLVGDPEKAGALNDPEKPAILENVATPQSDLSQPFAERTTTTTALTDPLAPRVFDDNGNVIVIPAPTLDPRDPQNLSFRHKLLGLGALCMFGALAAAAEYILGAMLPVFALYYAGIDPGPYLVKVTDIGGFPPNFNPLKQLENLPNVPKFTKLYQLATLPILMIGASNLFLVPLAIAIGRRPVLLFCGLMAIAGCTWAGFSTSLETHIAARCIQALGAGTVESLIPLMISDMIPFHQRNTWIASIFAVQCVIINVLGICATNLTVWPGWRWTYYITSIGAGFFLVLVFLFMPETRWSRTKEELRGIPRPDSDFVDAQPRTWRYNLKIQNGPLLWRSGWLAFADSCRTFFYPHIFLITILNSAMIAAAFASIFTVVPVLITAPYGWHYRYGGLCGIPLLIANFFVLFVSGRYADKLANYFARKRGYRAPENQLINLVFPAILSVVGCLLFGLAAQHPYDYSWAVLLLGLGMVFAGFLGTSTVGAVYVLECLPQLPG